MSLNRSYIYRLKLDNIHYSWIFALYRKQIVSNNVLVMKIQILN